MNDDQLRLVLRRHLNCASPHQACPDCDPVINRLLPGVHAAIRWELASLEPAYQACADVIEQVRCPDYAVRARVARSIRRLAAGIDP